ncbi:hypothetical protein SKB0092_17270 [Roseomonas mucosa]
MALRRSPWLAAGGEALPLPPDPLSAGDRSRSPDPGLSWVPVVAISLRPDPWEQVEARGSRKEEKQRVRAGGTRDPASVSANEREVQDPQGPGG